MQTMKNNIALENNAILKNQSLSKMVPRISIHDLTPRRFYKEYQRPGKPLIITHALENATPLNIDKVVSMVGDLEVPIRNYGAERFTRPKTEWKKYCEIQTYKVKDYCDLLSNGKAKQEHMYLALVEMGHTVLRKVLGPGIDLIAKNTGLRQDFPNDLNLWMGPSTHIEPLHYDGLDGTLSQFRGSKKVSLFRPGLSRHLYPGKSGSALLPTFSQPYINKPDFVSYPNLVKALAERQDVILAEGETLYIPAGWWHEVEALGDDYIASVNRFWKVDPIWRFMRSPRAGFYYFLSKIITLKKK